MELAGLSLGLASEGAFGSGPFGLYALNLELVTLIDAVRGIEIVGRSEVPGLHGHESVRTREELEDAARRYGFPEHGLVVRPNDEDDPRIRKGLCAWDSLLEAFAQAQSESSNGAVFVENDLRAHMNPTRMSNIALATDDLIKRMSSRCATCRSPGFGLAARLPGLPCNDCRMPSQQARANSSSAWPAATKRCTSSRYVRQTRTIASTAIHDRLAQFARTRRGLGFEDYFVDGFATRLSSTATLRCLSTG